VAALGVSEGREGTSPPEPGAGHLRCREGGGDTTVGGWARWAAGTAIAALLLGCTATGTPIVDDPVSGASEPSPAAPAAPEPAPQAAGTADPPGVPDAVPAGGSAAILTVDLLLADDGQPLDDPRLFWVMTPVGELPGEAVVEGPDVARLWTEEGELLAQSVVEGYEMTPDCEPGATCRSQRGLHAALVVPSDAEQAHRLEVLVEGEQVVELHRGDDVSFAELDVPAAGELTPPVTVRWRATGGEVTARLVPEPGASPQGGATALELGGPPQGSLQLEQQHLYPGPGAVLELVVMDGLAFDHVRLGPYRSAVPLAVEWLVMIDGEPIEELGTLVHDPRRWAYLRRDVQVLVSTPGGGYRSGTDLVRARWVSDRDGDLTEVNLDPAPDLYLPSYQLRPGRHVLTLSLEVDTIEGPASHTVQLDLEVLEP
jgi:hypothetical protein